MFGYYIPWRPAPGEVIPRITDALHAIRQATHDDNYITWRNSDGEWVVSYKLSNGELVDLAWLGRADRPAATPGAIATMKSVVDAAKMGKGPLKEAQAVLASRERSRLNTLEDKQGESNDYRHFLRRKSIYYSDHPLLNPGGVR